MNQSIPLSEIEAEMMASRAGITRPYWIGEWSGDTYTAVSDIIRSAYGKQALIILYNIPGRDNGNYSAGGLDDSNEYSRWIAEVVRAIGPQEVIIILEPDALGLSVSLDNEARLMRFTMFNDAIAQLKTNPLTKVYIDSSIWSGVDTAVELLSHVNGVDGFSCNVSGYQSQTDCMKFSDAVSSLTGFTYIIDTSRNGNGAPHGAMWCNQTDTRVGIGPTFDTGNPRCDAFLWIKVPGESDGRGINDDGSRPRDDVPKAGELFPEFKLAIYDNSKWPIFKMKYSIKD